MNWNQLDLKIELSSSQIEGMQPMIEKFLSRKQHHFCAPVLEGNTLRINSSDFIISPIFFLNLRPAPVSSHDLVQK